MTPVELMEFVQYALICGILGPVCITFGLGLMLMAYYKLTL